MSEQNDLPQRDRWARLRFAIVGPLLAAPPEAGELHAALNLLAAKAWRHPFTGLEVRFGVSTIERWLYAAKRAGDPVRALRNQVRGDIGRFPSLSAEAVQALTSQYTSHPGWTAQLHHDNLRVTLAATDAKCPSYPSVRRYLKAQGLLRQRPSTPGERGRHCRPRSARTTRGAQLRSRACPAADASGLPSRLTQGPDPRRRST